MAYVPLTTQSAGGTILAAWANQVKDNFAAGVPDLFTTKGDIAVGTGADAGARLAAGTDYQVLQTRAAATLGAEWGSGIYSLCSHLAAQSIPNGSLTKLNIDAAVQDPSSMLDAINFRLTIPVGFPTRQYMVMASGYFSGHATVDKNRGIFIYNNGSLYMGQNSQQDDASADVYISTMQQISLAATNYVELYVLQSSGTSINFNNGRLGLFMIR